MGKRSRDASFSPSVDSALTPSTSDASSQIEGVLPQGKAVHVDNPEVSPSVMQCSLPPHREAISFPSIEDYELHYVKDHSNRCASCGCNFPTGHFLNLHFDENHNPLRAAAQAKGERTYACFVEDCDRKCSTPQKRRLHLIDKHMFPKLYNFRIVDNGIDKSVSMLRGGQRRRLSTTDDSRSREKPRTRSHNGFDTSQGFAKSANSSSRKRGNAQQLSPPPTSNVAAIASDHRDAPGSSATKGKLKSLPEDDLADLEKSMSALRFVPTSVLRRQGNTKSAD